MASNLKPFCILLLFVAAFLIITGIYEQKIEAAENNKKIEYRFIPRTYYEEQLAQSSTVHDKVGEIFAKESPWFDRTVGVLADVDYYKKLESREIPLLKV
jgi:hypothetical protein